MPDISLNLDNFLKHTYLASDSDTVVMRNDGKTSARGRIRSFFTKNADYRDTTRQFIDLYCRGQGVKREDAELFFEENLREEGAKPLEARKVKSFLAQYSPEGVLRAKKYAAFQALPAKAKPGLEKVRQVLSETAKCEGLRAIPSGAEVLHEIEMVLARLPERNCTDNNLFASTKSILNDGRLTNEQCIRRLNLLTNFIDPKAKNAKDVFKVDYNSTFERAVFQRMLEATDAEGFDWNVSAKRMLGQVCYQLSSKDPASNAEAFLTGNVNARKILESVVSQVKGQVVQAFIPKMIAVAPIPNKTEEEQIALWKDVFSNDDAVEVIDRHAFSAMYQYRTTSLKEFVKDITTYALAFLSEVGGNSFSEFMPDVEFDLRQLQNPAKVQENIKMFSFTLPMTKTMLSPNDLSNVAALGSTEKRLGTADKALSEGKMELMKDFHRHCSARGELRCLDYREMASHTGGFVVYDKATQKGYLENSSLNTCARFQTHLKAQNLSVRDFTQEELDDRWNRSGCEKDSDKVELRRKETQQFVDKIEALGGGAANGKQIGTVVLMMGQNQDEQRDVFAFLGGTHYNKAIIWNEDGTVSLVHASSKDSPVHLCKIVTVKQNGDVVFDEKETYVTTDPTKATPKLRELQDFFEAMNSGFAQKMDAVEASAQEKTLMETHAMARAKMYDEGISYRMA